MKQNRSLCLILSLALVLGLLTACGSGSPSSSAGSSSASSSSASDSARFRISKTYVSLYKVGDQYQLSVSGVPEGAEIRWSSSEPAIATVEQDGTVTAVSPGIAYIYAAYGDQTVECGIQCKFEEYAGDLSTPLPSQSQSALVLDRSSLTLSSAGATARLSASGQEDGAALIWASSDEFVATVDQNGIVTAVSQGSATISVSVLTDPGQTASCAVLVSFSQSQSDPEPTPDPAPAPGSDSQPSAGVDLAQFYAQITSQYEFSSFLEAADTEMQDIFYPGLSDILTRQCLVYVVAMSMNMGEVVLVQVSDSQDVDAVKAILQARVDSMVESGAFYPDAVEQWTNNARVVSSGDCVMLVVNAQCDEIVRQFNALF